MYKGYGKPGVAPAFSGGFGKGYAPKGGKGFAAPPKGGGFEEEDRSRDWYCPNCRERNFVKRAQCFKCGTLKPADGALAAARPAIPMNGATMHGMVKSYNRKGFGFLMCLGTDFGQDIYYTRENLSPRLQTRDIPGQHVTFEIHRFPDGKLTAINIRPQGEDKEEGMRPPAMSKGGGGSFGKGSSGKQDDEDRSRDWVCGNCGERNFVKRFECFKCGQPRSSGFSAGPERTRSRSPPPAPPKRTLSPHAGARAIREMLAGGRNRSGSRSRSRGRGGRKRDDSSESSDSSPSRERRKKDSKKKKKRKKSRSSSSGDSDDSQSEKSSKSSDCEMEEPAEKAAAADDDKSKSTASGNPEVDKAKSEALQELLKLREVNPKEVRMSEWRALLRKWHPDKNPDRVEVATAVFQFLQKGKAILNDAAAE